MAGNNKLTNKRKITIFFLTIVIFIIIIIIISILFSQLVPSTTKSTTDTSTQPTTGITIFTTQSLPKLSKERKDITSISGKTIDEKNFPYKSSNLITIDVSHKNNTIIVKPCISNASKYFQRQQLNVTEQDVINMLKDKLKTEIDQAIKNADINSQKNTIEYSDDQSC